MNRSLSVKLARVVVAACAVQCAGMRAVLADTPPTDTVIVARGGARPLLLWDATAAVADAVRRKSPHERTLRELESKAVKLGATKAATLPLAQDVTIRIVYQRTGAVSETYKTATFAGLEKVVALHVKRADLVKNADAIATALADGKTPTAVQVEKTGSLP